MPDPKPQLTTSVAVHNALHGFDHAPSLEEIKAKARELQQTVGQEEAGSFLRIAVAISPAVSPEQRLAVNERVRAAEAQYGRAAGTPAGKRPAAAAQPATSDPDVGAGAPAEQLAGTDAEEERLLARARAASSPQPPPQQQPVSILSGPGTDAAAAALRDAGSGALNLIDRARVAVGNDPIQDDYAGRPLPADASPEVVRTPARGGPAPAAPPPRNTQAGPTTPIGGRKGQTTVTEPKAQPDIKGADDDDERSLLDKAKDLIKRLQMTSEQQDAVDEERRSRFRNPPERTVEL